MFSTQEIDDALAAIPLRDQLTHSQQQLRAADATYRWMRLQPVDLPVNAALILNIHRRIVTGCDDDHCEPGALRGPASPNVTFGQPRCRGADGGELDAVFGALTTAIAGEFQAHDRIIQALATHYHIGAMHPFGDGNGRTGRALEAFMLRRAGINDVVMVSMSNYYYEHMDEYLATLYQSRQRGHDITPFLRFALRAVAERCGALAEEIATRNKRTLYREFARSLFGQLRNSRRRALGERQLHIIDVLVESNIVEILDLVDDIWRHYENLKHPERAINRDLNELLQIAAINIDDDGDLVVNLDWPQQFSESDFLKDYKNMAAAAASPTISGLSRLLGRRRR